MPPETCIDTTKNDEISTPGQWSRRMVTSQLTLIHSFYHIQTHRQTRDDMTQIQAAYVGRNLVAVRSVVWTFVGLSFLSSQPAKEHV